METAKQKAIREAYGEHWEFLKDFINEEGWFRDYVLGESESLSIWALSNCDKEFDSVGIVWRHSTLKGIETNNGWINIESESDLPKEGNYWVIGKNGEMYDSPKYGNSFVDDTDYWIQNLTHYQPILKPLKPIY